MDKLITEMARALHDVVENDDDSDGGAYLRAARAILPIAFEAAATICDDVATRWRDGSPAAEAAVRIRALKMEQGK